jgi:hypothetical protein
MDEEYIIGCDKWVRGERYHRYTKVPEDVNLELLRKLPITIFWLTKKQLGV